VALDGERPGEALGVKRGRRRLRAAALDQGQEQPGEGAGRRDEKAVAPADPQRLGGVRLGARDVARAERGVRPPRRCLRERDR
jgi:hypothetical protein